MQQWFYYFMSLHKRCDLMIYDATTLFFPFFLLFISFHIFLCHFPFRLLFRASHAHCWHEFFILLNRIRHENGFFTFTKYLNKKWRIKYSVEIIRWHRKKNTFAKMISQIWQSISFNSCVWNQLRFTDFQLKFFAS